MIVFIESRNDAKYLFFQGSIINFFQKFQETI